MNYQDRRSRIVAIVLTALVMGCSGESEDGAENSADTSDTASEDAMNGDDTSDGVTDPDEANRDVSVDDASDEVVHLQLASTAVDRCEISFLLPAKFAVPPQVAQCTDSQTGDMEMTVDGEDLLVVYNDPTVNRERHPAQGVELRVLDGSTGLNRDPEVVEQLADNYFGCFGINGPEWVVPDPSTNMDLGIVYRGANCVVDECDEDGVHAVFREVGAGTTEFLWDYGPSGFREFEDNPPQPLPSTYAGAYPDYGYSNGHNTYISFGDPAGSGGVPPCLGTCFGHLDAVPSGSTPPMTSIREAVAPRVFGASGGHPLQENTVYVSAGLSGTTSLWELTIDGEGGASTPVKLIDTPSLAESTSLVAEVFPGTNDTIIFSSNQTPTDPEDPDRVADDTISVVYPDDSGDLQLEHVTLSNVGNPLGDINHFRVNQGELLGFPVLVLHFLVREAAEPAVVGSYALIVYRRGGQYAFVDPLFLGPDVYGPELIWLPDGQREPSDPAGAWAFYRLREDDTGETRFQVDRCWWGPQ